MNVDGYESYMQQGVQAQRVGDHAVAYNFRSQALNMAETNVQLGRAHRDLGASCSKLGDDNSALEHFFDSKEVLLGATDPAERRELYASQGQLARFAGHVLLGTEVGTVPVPDKLTGFSVATEIDAAYQGLRALESTGPDQYRINLAARRSALFTFEGRRRQGFLAALDAGRLALKSESPHGAYSDPSLSLSERMKVKFLHTGLAAVALIASMAPHRQGRQLISKVVS